MLTDGTVALDDLGHETKRFNAKDGLGIAIWRRMGGEVAVITGRAGQAVRHRLEELGVRQLHSGTSDKAAALRAVAATMVASARESSMRAGRPVATRRTPSGVASVGVPSGAGVITSRPVNDTVTTSSSDSASAPKARPRSCACRGPAAAVTGTVPSIRADAIPSPEPRRIQNTASTRSPVTREMRPSSAATMSTESNIESWKSRAPGAAGAACA
ncbi:MAG: hypothetical protein ACKOTD_00760, partial [Phycisphaerales bacterium]